MTEFRASSLESSSPIKKATTTVAFFVGEARYLIEQGRDSVRGEIRNRVSEVQVAIAEP